MKFESDIEYSVSQKKDYLFSNGSKNFWHWVNFKLQLSDRKVIICFLKVCSNLFQICPYFCHFDNSKVSYRHLKKKVLFLGHTVYK